MGPSAPSPPRIEYRDNPVVQQPTREDPAIEEARQQELRRQQLQRGRSSTLIVNRPAKEDLLPAMAGNGASVLGTG